MKKIQKVQVLLLMQFWELNKLLRILVTYFILIKYSLNINLIKYKFFSNDNQIINDNEYYYVITNTN